MLKSISIKAPADKRQPGLAVVLGSGGVRSIAGLGMLDVLLRAGIVPDLIVGCSAGALFGAGVAAGNSVDEALRLATTLWSPELTEQTLWKAYAQLLMPRWFKFGQDFALRKDQLIMERLGKAFGRVDIRDLPTPLRIMATDATRGTSVVLERGDLVQAIRASISLPFLFSPVKLGEQWLVDGVVSDPLPVSAAADARMVIAMGFETPMPRKVNRASRLVMQSTTAMINNLQQARIDSARARGQPLVTIMPSIDRRVGLFQTSAMPYLVETGRLATQAMLPQIEAMLERRTRFQASTDHSNHFGWGGRLRSTAVA
jgi:NTE family protein